MATTPYFILSPSTVLSIVGLLHGPDRTVPNPAEDWRAATVDVVIPAFDEESNIALCLAALARQTRKPARVILIDDGSRDRTVEYARAFGELNGMEILIIQRARSIGKTPSVKRQSRESESDVEFILDADTVLESENYIDRVVEELYKGAGIACACGTVLPLRDRDRRGMLEDAALQRFLRAHPESAVCPVLSPLRHLQRGITELYRDVLYIFLQKFIYVGQMMFFGSILNPVGCAVAYRRSTLRKIVFDRYEPILGDDLTHSEDIFIGFAMNDNGYRNIQLTDVYARSQEPEAGRVPHQVYLWSSAFLQSCYFFDQLIRSPLKAFARYRRNQQEQAAMRAGLAEKRVHREQYRQPFGSDYTARYGRPIGWLLFMAAVEKIAFPTIICAMMLLQLWEPLAITLAAETVVATGILVTVTPGHRLEYLYKGLLVTPLRYGVLLFDLVTILRVAADLWLFRNRRWRK